MALFDRPGCFCWAMRHRARLILSECYSPNFPLCLESRPQNKRFYAYLTAHDRRGSCNPRKISATLKLQLCDEVHFYFFDYFQSVMTHFEFLSYTFICAAFKLEEWSNTQRISAPTTTWPSRLELQNTPTASRQRD